jgi:hypothetical protein
MPRGRAARTISPAPSRSTRGPFTYKIVSLRAGLAEKQNAAPGAYDTTLGEFVLRDDDVRGAADPSAMVLDFLQESYAAAAEAASWNREMLGRTMT